MSKEMTYRDAINYARGMLRNGGNYGKQKFVQVVIEAMEKQIPKKPTITNKGTVTRCPACGAIHFPSVPNVEIDYCQRCGQAIDWSDAE